MRLHVFRIGRLAAVVALIFLIPACGSSGPSVAKIKGKVTLDGQPLAEGLVNFRPVGDDAPTASGIVKNGEFTAEVPVTKMRVSISASKVTGQRKAYNTPDSPLVDIVTEIIPAKYNSKSELVHDIKPDTKELNFELISDPAPGKK
ncbi:hypothetical protein [Zavarzinella formosa]|uniref:hypothetical protein n=1 Tax=Zavarzinella formosa TaxID=360055 RepID=UPI000308AC4D|nr:hypothetical protein [Zavarzinella formosa]